MQVSRDELLILINQLYWCLINHPPEPSMFKERTKLLSEAHELTKYMDVPYGLPDSED